MLLPSDMSKGAVYRFYVRACESEQVSIVSCRTFENIWKELCPYIAAMKPATDLCHTCQQNANLMKSANVPEELKSQRLHDAQTHLDLARVQRQHYNEQCTVAKENITSNPPLLMHYSFDYAQQVHYPFNAQQPGPIFFKTARKCGIFGVSCEATSSQMNCLIDEADEIGEGANATISLIHHYLQTHGLKERHLLLHADNCVGQIVWTASSLSTLRAIAARHYSSQRSHGEASSIQPAPATVSEVLVIQCQDVAAVFIPFTR